MRFRDVPSFEFLPWHLPGRMLPGPIAWYPPIVLWADAGREEQRCKAFGARMLEMAQQLNHGLRERVQHVLY